MYKYIGASLTVIFIIIITFSVNVNSQTTFGKKSPVEGPASAKPTPTPVPTPTPGCATTAVNTNSWSGSGGLDPSFGTGTGPARGTVMTDIGGPSSGNEGAVKILVQADGKVVTVGSSLNPSGLSGVDTIVIRYNQNGSLDTGDGLFDPGFGETDPAHPGLRLGYKFIIFSPYNDQAKSAVLDGSGRILVTSGGGVEIARLLQDGQLDTNFGTGGIARVAVAGLWSQDIAVDSLGRIIIAGGNDTLTVARFDSFGNLDTSFGSGGSVQIFASGRKASIWGTSVAMQWVGGNELIVVGGQASSGRTDPGTFALMRFTSTGAQDFSFGTNGLVLTSFSGNGDRITDIAIDANNRIVAVGIAFTNCGADAAYARYTTNGYLDTTFSGDGKFTQDIYGGTNYALGVALQPGVGSAPELIVASGFAINPSGTAYDLSLVRLKDDGTPDTSFGPGTGIISTDIGGTGNGDGGLSVAIQSDRKIVVSGWGGVGDASVVTRYLP